MENLKDEKENVILGKRISIACTERFLKVEEESMQIIGLGLNDILVIAMPDGVLTADKARSQDIKPVVSELKKKDISQA